MLVDLTLLELQMIYSAFAKANSGPQYGGMMNEYDYAFISAENKIREVLEANGVKIEDD